MSYWLILAGLGGGLTGSVAGLASLVSYPALLAAGLPPVTANVSNTVALVCSSIGSVSGSRRELRGQRSRALQLGGVAIVGGVVGGVLLLVTPSDTFALIVPWLIGLASVAIMVGRGPGRQAHAASAGSGRGLRVGVFLVAVYGGYFGAAAGVLLLALLLLGDAGPLAKSNAMKNLLLGLANGVAAVAFALFGPVRWSAVVPLGAGFLVGGRLGPSIVRRAPVGPLRVLIACGGVGLAVHLGLNAYR